MAMRNVKKRKPTTLLFALVAACMTATTVAQASDFPLDTAQKFLKNWPAGLDVGEIYGVQSSDIGATMYFDGQHQKCGEGVWTLRAIRMDGGVWFVTNVTASSGGLGPCGWKNRMVNLTNY